MIHDNSTNMFLQLYFSTTVSLITSEHELMCLVLYFMYVIIKLQLKKLGIDIN